MSLKTVKQYRLVTLLPNIDYFTPVFICTLDGIIHFLNEWEVVHYPSDPKNLRSESTGPVDQYPRRWGNSSRLTNDYAVRTLVGKEDVQVQFIEIDVSISELNSRTGSYQWTKFSFRGRIEFLLEVSVCVSINTLCVVDPNRNFKKSSLLMLIVVVLSSPQFIFPWYLTTVNNSYSLK